MSLIRNQKATYNYEILEKFEAGIELSGIEVKTIRNSHGSLEGSYVKFKGTEAYLVGGDFPPYQPGNTPLTYDRNRARKLLLSKKELLNLKQKTEKEGLTLIPLSLYNKGRKIKAEIALARGKKSRDKRETIKRREDSREMHRVIKRER